MQQGSWVDVQSLTCSFHFQTEKDTFMIAKHKTKLQLSDEKWVMALTFILNKSLF
jgi:hypothetical protein